MLKQWSRMILLIFAIFALENMDIMSQFSGVAHAASIGDVSPLVGGKANHPSCESSGVVPAILGGVAGGLATLYAGWVLIVTPDPTGVTKAQGAAMVAGGTIALTSLVTANTQFFACTHSFVRHPVLRWDADGKYKKCKNPEYLFPSDPGSGKVCKSQEYIEVSDYNWPENKAPHSDYIEVCNRSPLGGVNPSLDDREHDFGAKGDFTSEYTSGGDTLYSMKKAIAWYSMSCKTIKVGETAVLNSISFKAYEDGGRICVDAVGSFGGEFWPFPPVIGCHARAPSPPAPMCAESIVEEVDSEGRPLIYDNTPCFNCYISGACYSQISLAARAPFPITSVVVQCIKESLRNLIVGECSLSSGKPSSGVKLLSVVQKRLKQAVQAVLVLSIALFGIKMMMGHALQGPHEYFMLLLKVALVIYFSLGNGMQVYYDRLIDLSVGLSDLVLSAGGSDQVCNYDTADYIRDFGQGYQNYSYLAPWDRLDCRLGFYLGNGFAFGGGAASAAAITAAATAPIFGVLLIIIPSLFAGQILIAICVAFFIFMLILTVIWITHLFILSLIAVTLVSFFAPVFVPMVLFQATKGFFDGWVKQLMAYSIYPIILFAFLSLVFSVFDKMYFDDLSFTAHIKDKEPDKEDSRLIEYFTPDYTKCDSNPTIIACIVSQMKYVDGPLMLGINAIKNDISEDTKNIWQGFAMMGLIGFLFYHFLGVIGSMAAELSGSFRADLSSQATGPKQMAAKLEAGAMKVSGAIGGGLKAAGKGIANKAKGGEKSEGSEEVSRSGATDSGSKGGGDSGSGDSGGSAGGGDAGAGGGSG